MFSLYRHQRIAVMTAVLTIVTAVALLLPVSTVSAANVSVSVCMFESNDTTPLSGASVSYYQNGGWRAFGSTDGSGCVTRSDIDSAINQFSISYLYTSVTKTQDISSGGQEVRFNTSPAVVKLADSVGSGLSGGVVSYYSFGGWRNLGTTDEYGIAQREILPGSYPFSVSYLYTSNQSDAVDITLGSGANPDYTFNTTPAVVKLADSNGAGLSGGVVSYYSFGGWRNLGTTDEYGIAQREILPGSYPFSVSYLYTSNQSDAVDIGTGNDSSVDHTFDTTPAVVKLADSDGAGLSGGVVSYYSFGGWRNLGTTDANGIAQREILPGSYPFSVSYLYTSNQSDAVDITLGSGANPDYTFNTTPAVVKLATCADVGLEGGVVSYYSFGGWRNLGTTDANGIAQREILPGSYTMSVSYKYVTNQSADPVDIGTASGTNPDYTFTTTTVTLNSNLNISYYSYGGWRSFTKPTMELLPETYHFRAGDHDFYLTVSGCNVIGGGNLVLLKLFNGDETLSDPHKLECSGVGYLQSGIYFTNKASWTCRGRYNGIAGPWFTFNTLDTILDYEFATVGVTLYSDVGEDNVIDEGDLLDDPHKVEVSGVGYFTTDSTFHVPPGANLSYRLRRNGIAGPWEHVSFIAGENDWALEFAAVDVTLYNDAGEDDIIDEGDLLGDPHQVEVSGVGYYTTGNTFFVPPGADLSFRLRRNGIAGPWDHMSFAAGDNPWALEFATVNVTLYSATDEILYDPHKVEVSGVGYYTSDSTFHVPPGANLSFRLRRNGIAGPWDHISFVAGENDWSLNYASVSVTLYNDEDNDGIGTGDLLYDPHKVEVSGVGYYTTDGIFHVPPGANLSFRLRRDGIAGPWQQRTFDVGATGWELEFATVEVEIELPSDVASQTRIEVSGVGYYYDNDTFHVPPGARLSFRLRNNGWASPWFSTDETGTFQAGEGHLIWGLTPRYEITP